MKDYNEKISIIVPVYNVEKTIRKCVFSLCNQTYKNVEIILIDDGSQDESGAICDELANFDTRIKVIHKQNGGLGSARNVGLDSSTGTYVTFVDSDDWVSENLIMFLYESIIDNGTDISICGHYIVKNDEIIDAIHDSFDNLVIDNKQAMNELIEDIKINSFAWGKLYRFSLFKEVRYPALKYHEDIYTAVYLFKNASKVSKINQLLYYYVRNPESISHKLTIEKQYHSFLAFRERQVFLKEHYSKLVKKNTPLLVMISMNTVNQIMTAKLSHDYYLREIRKELKSNLLNVFRSCTLKRRKKLQVFLYVVFPSLYRLIIKKDTNNDKQKG